MNFPYVKLPGDASGVLKPYIPVRYHYKNSFTKEILTLIDSGADTSHFSTDLANFFNIDWKKLKIQKSNAANNSTFLAYVFEEPFTIEIGGHKLTINRANFSPDLAPPFPFILGQDNFFDLCRITFERYKWNIDLNIK
ncbi:MAG: retropepsin-like aspartic protease [bacterium]|nr:retropepsin-like aspartic protease [bacterium]